MNSLRKSVFRSLSHTAVVFFSSAVADVVKVEIIVISIKHVKHISLFDCFWVRCYRVGHCRAGKFRVMSRKSHKNLFVLAAVC
jgi:hypothetical protein